MWIEALAGALAGAGAFLMLEDVFRVPSYAASAAAGSLAGRNSGRRGRADVLLSDLSSWIASRLRIGEYRRGRLQADLRTAGINKSPEAFTADCAVKALLAGIFSVPAYFVFPALSPAVLFLAVLTYVRETRAVERGIRKKREQIEYELPGLVSHVRKTLAHNRDVLYILDSYRENAGPGLRPELDVTVADMRSGNLEAALGRLENRVGSSMLSDVSRGLAGVLRGDETDAYWAGLSLKFTDWQRQLLRREAQKVPSRVRRLSMCLLLCFMAVFIVVIGYEIVSSMGVLFG